ncbi:MAG: hypothetical protein JF597_06320 [Streptomyces sp.]|uniref:hypothetical protein n=1 Tax=Streptomyces sp. TaxID=1931 RepID=UPI0025CC8F13|nr:hypothetical protein [Streptomyces sp.]MBW8793205.1 hypothetical protein [Streptomyces sp.]
MSDPSRPTEFSETSELDTRYPTGTPRRPPNGRHPSTPSYGTQVRIESSYFPVDAESIVIAALDRLARQGAIASETVAEARDRYGRPGRPAGA